MKYHESQEMYLETILLLKKERQSVRSVDIVEHLGYAKSSVSRAVKLLKKAGYIDIDESGEIQLTQQGTRHAENIYERHEVITKALIKMGAEFSSAEENACRIEHVISDDMIEVIKNFISSKD